MAWTRATTSAAGRGDHGEGDDLYEIPRDVDGSLTFVLHFVPSQRDEHGTATRHRFCCRVDHIVVTDADRAAGGNPDIAALTRVNLLIERRHGRGAPPGETS